MDSRPPGLLFSLLVAQIVFTQEKKKNKQKKNRIPFQTHVSPARHPHIIIIINWFDALPTANPCLVSSRLAFLLRFPL